MSPHDVESNDPGQFVMSWRSDGSPAVRRRANSCHEMQMRGLFGERQEQVRTGRLIAMTVSRIAITALAILTSGCAGGGNILETPYVPKGHWAWSFGGYYEQKFSDSSYRVYFEHNIYTSRETSEKFLRRRAEELCGSPNYTVSSAAESTGSSLAPVNNVAVPVSVNTVSMLIECEGAPKS